MDAFSSKFDAVKKVVRLRLTSKLSTLLLLTAFAASAASAANPPTTIIDDSVQKTVSVAAADGWKPCPGSCLKLSQEGWKHMHVNGFADTDYWMVFPFTDTNGPSWYAYSQRHIGHIIRTHPDKAAEDTGNCPTCNGTGWVKR